MRIITIGMPTPAIRMEMTVMEKLSGGGVPNPTREVLRRQDNEYDGEDDMKLSHHIDEDGFRSYL